MIFGRQFPTISVADVGHGEMCFPAFSLLEKFAYMAIYHRIDQDILSRKSLHKDADFCVILDILVGKVNK